MRGDTVYGHSMRRVESMNHLRRLAYLSKLILYEFTAHVTVYEVMFSRFINFVEISHWTLNLKSQQKYMLYIRFIHSRKICHTIF